ncbi:hypothetical protein [Dyadobacter sp. LHD-138]|uniref:hypothetical protein n=1 Tax=Dyadobacter sp. LHD-138 TaxID=3071413 RepID=UPI0027E10C7C|nr:hypothetical protein [Dyadobacter sp. LHD-138]MDQ6480554.1 hypothetical protein [Dyadobacter sp. LHD-138]
MQDRTSYSINRTDTSISRSKQLDMAIPASKIAGLSSGEFVGMVADNPDEKIELKTFHAEIINDHKAIAAEQQAYVPIPAVRTLDENMVNRNYNEIRQDVQSIADSELERILEDPGLTHLIIQKNRSRS